MPLFGKKIYDVKTSKEVSILLVVLLYKDIMAFMYVLFPSNYCQRDNFFNKIKLRLIRNQSDTIPWIYFTNSMNSFIF